MLWTKRVHQSRIFQIFQCFKESSPNSSCHFSNHKVKVYSNFPSLFSVMKDNSSKFLQLKLLYIGQKEPIEVSKFFRLLNGQVKFTKFLMPCLKLQVSFSLNFASLFSVMRDNSSVFSQLKLYMTWTKRVHQSAKFQTFNCSLETLPNLYLDKLLLLKVYKISAKKLQSSYVS